MVSGQYVSKMSEASHVLFEGHLDDPSFKRIAIQRIIKLDGESVTLDTSGTLKIETLNGRQSVKTSFVCPLFGKQTTVGNPFKDRNTDAITANDPDQGRRASDSQTL